MPIETEMQKLVTLLNDACKLYYAGVETESPLTDAQYDRYLKELEELEKRAGYRLAESPTAKVGYEESDDKIKHYAPILSLRSTKDITELLYFLEEEEALLSWKLDGVGIVLYYQNGNLDRAVSRGDGTYGKDITHNVLKMSNVPKQIPIKNVVIIRGEGCISLPDFDELKQTDEGEKYRNPRNLAAGLINSTKKQSPLLRYMSFITHSIILLEGYGRNYETKAEQLDYLSTLGFKVVPYFKVANYTLKNQIEIMSSAVNEFEYPVDGLVLTMNNISYGRSLGTTSKFPRDSMAFKWPDVSVVTPVQGMKWSVSQTGLITPIVLVKPVQLEGTIVKQANLHTLKNFEDLGIGIGDPVVIYKANKIIPEIQENLSRSATEDPPDNCPVCGAKTFIVATDKTKKLYCSECSKKEEK